MRLELRDFSGGITDFIYTDDYRTSEYLDNLVITKDKAITSRPGSRVLDNYSSKPITLINKPQEIIDFYNQEFMIFGGEIVRHNNGTYEKIVGPNSLYKPLYHAGIDTTYSYSIFNKHLFITDNAGSKAIKVFKNQAGSFKLVTAGLPKLATVPTLTTHANNGKTYVYSFVYYYEYMVEDNKFIDISAVVSNQVIDASDMTTAGITINDIPVLANSTTTQYDVNAIKVKIYRTIDGGTTSYFVGEVSNGITSYIDNLSDEDLQTREVLYTDGGIAENDEPPVAKFLEVTNSCGYYGNIDGYPYRLLQSQIADVDSVPAANYIDFEETILGISSYQSNLVVFTDNQVWRVEGTIELDGSGFSRKVLVEDKVGFIGGVVKADGGIYFCGHDSFYYTNGYEVKPIPSVDRNIPNRYKIFSAYGSSVSGCFDRINKRVYWAVRNSLTNYQIYVYDMAFNALTTWSGVDGSFSTCALACTKNGTLYRGDISGYVFKFSDLYLDDPVIDLTKSHTQWENYPIIYKWKHIALDFGASDVHKYFTKVTLSGNGETNLDLQINSYDDGAIIPKALAPINFKSGFLWGDETILWGDHNILWGVEDRFNQTRRFVSGRLRAKRKQLEVTNAIINIAQSYSDLPDSRVTVNSALKTATVINPSLALVPQDCVGDTIYINNKPFVITDAGSDTFRLKDDFFELVDGTFDWYIKGIPQQQKLHLSSVIFTYEMLDDRGGYLTKETSNNA